MSAPLPVRGREGWGEEEIEGGGKERGEKEGSDEEGGMGGGRKEGVKGGDRKKGQGRSRKKGRREGSGKEGRKWNQPFMSQATNTSDKLSNCCHKPLWIQFIIVALSKRKQLWERSQHKHLGGGYVVCSVALSPT